MKVLIKLLVVAAILNATAHAALASWNHYALEDAAQQLLLFGGRASLDELQQDILRRAAELDIDLRPDRLTLERDGDLTRAAASYTTRVELLPRFAYPVNLSFAVEAHRIAAGR